MNDLFKRTSSSDFPAYLKVLVTGPPKSGKTTLLGTVPNILVLDTEPHANNLESIAHLDVPYATITNTDDLRQIAFQLRDNTLRRQLAEYYGLPDIQAVAIDTLDTLQKIMKVERMKEQKSSQFLRDDWGWLKTEMEAILQEFTSLPMHVFFIVHTGTKEMGKGDASYTVVLPGLEGSISQSIAGMVGYSLLAFRTEEMAADGTKYTKYWLKTEGDDTHEFLGTRTAGRLPAQIEPDMATIYNAVMAGRKAAQSNASAVKTAVIEASAALITGEEVAQNEGQDSPVQTAVQTPPVQVDPSPEPPAKTPDDEPVNAAALTHVKKVYDAVGLEFPEEIISKLTIGEARGLVMAWRAVQADHAEGKGAGGLSPQEEMVKHLISMGWTAEPSTQQASARPAAADLTPAEGNLEGTVAEVLSWARGDLERIQEGYDREVAKGDAARKGLLTKLESLGAKVQTPVETPSEQVASVEPVADEPTAEEGPVGLIQEQLGGTVISEEINANAKCEVCGNPIDDLELAELGQKRFDKQLCVKDYLAETRK